MKKDLPKELRDHLFGLSAEEPFAEELVSLRNQLISVSYVPHKYSTEYADIDDMPTLGILNGFFSAHSVQREKDKHALIWASLGGGRKSSDVVEVYALLFDFDGTVDSSVVEKLLRQRGLTFVLHSSYSSGATEKFRVIIFLRAPIPLRSTPTCVGIGSDGYRRLYHAAVVDIFGREAQTWVDAVCCNASRLFYLPAIPPAPDAPPFIRWADGELFDWRPVWEATLAIAPCLAQPQSAVRLPKRRQTVSSGVDELRAHLRFLEPDGYQDWLLGIMVIRNETGASDDGLSLAHEWSARSRKYDPASTDAKWNSLSDDRNDKCMLGSLIWRIRQQKPDYLKRPRSPSALSREELNAAYSSL